MSAESGRTAAILGLGLIGGSLGLALHATPHPPLLHGWDRAGAAGELALTRGAIDILDPDPAACVRDADVVILAVPVGAMREVFVQIAPQLKPGTIVTDVGSTKREVCAWARAVLPAHAHFVGGHPMAGSEQVGIANARADLLKGARFYLTPERGTDDSALATLQELISDLGARPMVVSAAQHDREVALTSHLPFLLSTTLVNLVGDDAAWESVGEWAGSGFRDITRLASGSVPMHRDICLTNADEIRSRLLAAAEHLVAVANVLDDPAALESWFAAAKVRRDRWLEQQLGERE